MLKKKNRIHGIHLIFPFTKKKHWKPWQYPLCVTVKLDPIRFWFFFLVNIQMETQHGFLLAWWTTSDDILPRYAAVFHYKVLPNPAVVDERAKFRAAICSKVFPSKSPSNVGKSFPCLPQNPNPVQRWSLTVFLCGVSPEMFQLPNRRFTQSQSHIRLRPQEPLQVCRGRVTSPTHLQQFSTIPHVSGPGLT